MLLLVILLMLFLSSVSCGGSIVGIDVAEEIQGRNEHLLQPSNEESKGTMDRGINEGGVESNGSNGHLNDTFGSSLGDQVQFTQT